MDDDSGGNLVKSLRESYDQLAEEYARRIYNELDGKPLDRELLSSFAAKVLGKGQVCDIGCGPGQVAHYLRREGVQVFGLDNSPKMLEEARRLNPDISFVQGNVLSLDLEDQSLAGVVAFYVICNLPQTLFLQAFREIERVLKPSGLLLISFHIGNEIIHESERWQKAISMDSFLHEKATVTRFLKEAKFEIEDVIERDPYTPDIEYQSRRAYIFARKRGL